MGLLYYFLTAYFVVASLIAFVNLRRSVYLFIYGYACFPFAQALAPFVYHHGLYAFDYYFFLAPFALLGAKDGKIHFFSRSFSIAVVGAMTIVFVSALVQTLVMNVPVTGTFLLDLRVPIVGFETILIHSLLRKTRIGGYAELGKLALASSIMAIIYWAMNCKGMFVHGDVYYDIFNRYRLWTSGSMVSMLYLLYWFVCPPAMKQEHPYPRTTLLLACIASLCAGERAVLGALVLTAIILTPYAARRFYAIVFVGIAGTFFVYVGILLGITRLLKGLTIAGLVFLLALRFSPAFPYLTNMGWHFLYGFGFGTTFYISWFNYRGLPPDNSTLDSMFVTYFVKYGVLSLLIFYVYVRAIIAKLPRRVAIATAIFFLLPSITYCMPAHPLFVGYPICASLIATYEISRRRKLIVQSSARHPVQMGSGPLLAAT